MTDRPLTPTQLAVLRAVARGEVSLSETFRTMHESFRWFPDRKAKVTATAERLASLGLIQLGDRERRYRPWLTTDAGNAVLAAHPEA